MIYQISSGQGPAECELGVAKLLSFLQSNYDVSVVSSSPGFYEGTYRSVRIYSDCDLSSFVGSVQWICRSPYRPEHKRKNWFIDFSVCTAVKTEKFDPKQVVFDTFRSGGKAVSMSIKWNLEFVRSIRPQDRPWFERRNAANTQTNKRR